MKPRLHNPKSRSHQMRGFSMVELLVVVAAILIVTSITIPIVNRSVMTYRLTDAATRVTSNIKMARFEAIRSDALVNWQIQQAGGTTTMYADVDRNGVVGPRDRAVIFNNNINVVSAGTVPNTAGLGGAMGLAAAPTAVDPANTAITFDARGAVTGVPRAYAVYVSDSNGGANANYRAVILLPSGLTQVWLAASDGAWQQLN